MRRPLHQLHIFFMNSEAPIIYLQDISFSYPGGKTVFDHLDFKFYSGDRIGLIAPNGSG
jgi:cobalt/nickel transport system ATP-binding protein